MKGHGRRGREKNSNENGDNDRVFHLKTLKLCFCFIYLNKHDFAFMLPQFGCFMLFSMINTRVEMRK